MKTALASLVTFGVAISAALVLRAVITPRVIQAGAALAHTPVTAVPAPSVAERVATAGPTSADISGWAAGSSVD